MSAFFKVFSIFKSSRLELSDQAIYEYVDKHPCGLSIDLVTAKNKIGQYSAKEMIGMILVFIIMVAGPYLWEKPSQGLTGYLDSLDPFKLAAFGTVCAMILWNGIIIFYALACRKVDVVFKA